MRERALLFGASKSLVGVVTEPDSAPAPDRPAVLLLNAGVLHRVGPNRLNVHLAREMARIGFLAMRFDFSGLGDSRPRTDGLPFAQATVAETREAMDVLASTRGARAFLLAGMCSGADNALRAAGHDPRVAGAALIEPMTVPGPGYLLYSYRRKLLNPLSWWRLLGGRSEVLGLLRRRAPAVQEDPAPVAARPASVSPAGGEADSLMPSREDFVRQVRALLERGSRLCFVYSAESPAYFNYLALLRRDMRRPLASGMARLRVIERTDHVFTPLAAQQALLATMRDWALTFADEASVAGTEEGLSGRSTSDA